VWLPAVHHPRDGAERRGRVYIGKLFGRHPLRSNISPRKTWEGAIGALCVSMLSPWALRFSFRYFEMRSRTCWSIRCAPPPRSSCAIGCAHITAYRDAHWHDVGTCYANWEMHIPFVPVMIVPYMSIDLFFVLAPFICTTSAELRAHARRVMLAIAVAGVSFLLVPLKPGYVRPDVHGIFAPIFHFLWSNDRQYNLAPSLHIALRGLLWAVCIRHTRRWLRRAQGVVRADWRLHAAHVSASVDRHRHGPFAGRALFCSDSRRRALAAGCSTIRHIRAASKIRAAAGTIGNSQRIQR